MELIRGIFKAPFEYSRNGWLFEREGQRGDMVILLEFVPILGVILYELKLKELKGGVFTCLEAPKSERLPGPFPDHFEWTQWNKFKILCQCYRTDVSDFEFFKYCFQEGGLIYKRGKEMMDFLSPWPQSAQAWGIVFPQDEDLISTLSCSQALIFAHRRTQKEWLGEEDLMVNLIYNVSQRDMDLSKGVLWKQNKKMVRLEGVERFLLPRVSTLGNRALPEFTYESDINKRVLKQTGTRFRVRGNQGHVPQQMFIQGKVIPILETRRILILHGNPRLSYHHRALWGNLKGVGDSRYVEALREEERDKDKASFFQIGKSGVHTLFRGNGEKEEISREEFHKRFFFSHLCFIEDFQSRVLPKIKSFQMVIWIGEHPMQSEKVMIYLKSVVPESSYLIEII